jgi:hypothetical protein
MPKTNDFNVFESKKIQGFKQKPNSPKITFDRGKNFRFNNKCSTDTDTDTDTSAFCDTTMLI